MSQTDDAALKHDADYVFGIFERYCKTFPLQRIPGASVCEIGPGGHVGMGLLYRCLGARTVHVVDKYLKPWTAEYHAPFYTLLADELVRRYPAADPAPLLAAARDGHGDCGIHIWSDDAELLSAIPDNSLDFFCSWAVLEHLYEPERAFARFGEVVRPGGLGVHQVDFRNHFDFSRPLEFLLHHYRWNEEPDESTVAWLAERLNVDMAAVRTGRRTVRSLIRSVCGYYGNSYRHVDYDALWAANGFTILDFDANLHADPAYLDDFLPRLAAAGTPAMRLSPAELAIVSACYLVRKQ